MHEQMFGSKWLSYPVHPIILKQKICFKLSLRLKLLCHLIVSLLGLLDLLCHILLLLFVLLQQFVGVLNLVFYQSHPVGKSSLHFLLGLVDENSTYLLEDFAVLLKMDLYLRKEVGFNWGLSYFRFPAKRGWFWIEWTIALSCPFDCTYSLPLQFRSGASVAQIVNYSL